MPFTRSQAPQLRHQRACRAQTYLLHLEVHRLLLVLQSTQLYTTIPSAPEGVHPFLDALMWQQDLAPSVVQVSKP